ncbi:MAG: MerR family transcriptional regulator [Nocardioidaceae bacterium]
MQERGSDGADSAVDLGDNQRAGSDGLLWGVGAVSSRLGIATPTLRTWDRRYGLGPSIRTEGGHRRYTETDVARVAMMSRLIESGVSAADGATSAAATAPDALTGSAEHRRPIAIAGRSSRSLVATIVRSACELDAHALSRTYASVLDRRGVVSGWMHVMTPALREIGRLWGTGELGVESEHLASERLATELRAFVHRYEPRRTGPPAVLLASAPGEQHSLPLLALEAALAERRISCFALGPRTPATALARAIELSNPRVVFLWATMQRARTEPLLVSLADDALRTILIGGPGWQVSADDLPEEAEQVDDLSETVGRIGELVGA